MERFCISILALIVWVTTTYAQTDGFVISNTNDTTYCNVRINAIFQPQYQDQSDGKYHTIKPKNFNGYRVNGSTEYVKRLTGNRDKAIFVVQLTKGKLNLYQQDGYLKDEFGNWISYTKFYIAAKNSKLVEFANEDGYLNKASRAYLYSNLTDEPKLAAGLAAEKELYSHKHFNIERVEWYVQQFNGEN